MATLDSDEVLAAKADEFLDQLKNTRPSLQTAREDARVSIDKLGNQLQREAVRLANLMQQPIQDVRQRSEDGGEVALALSRLQSRISELAPDRHRLESKLAEWLARYLPFMQSPFQRYAATVEDAQEDIDNTIRSLEVNRDILRRDNITLGEDLKDLRQLEQDLSGVLRLGQVLNDKIDGLLADPALADDLESVSFLREELQFSLRQRIIDLQQQLLITQQGILAVDLVISNNEELIRATQRTLTVTVSAFRVAVTVAMALSAERSVLRAIRKFPETPAAKSMASLKESFAQMAEATREFEELRSRTLPQIAKTIQEMQQLERSAKLDSSRYQSAVESPSSSRLTLD